jgi:hypothetical protein
MDCHQAIIEPILTSDDPRLLPDFAPLPFDLVLLWQEENAPIAPYVEYMSALYQPTSLTHWQDIFLQLKDVVSA